MNGDLTLISEVIDAYNTAKVTALSPHTIRDYGLTFKRLCSFLPTDRAIQEITPNEIRGFLDTIPGGRKNKQNAHIALGALWSFAIEEEITRGHTVRKVKIAKPEQRAIIPFSRDDIELLLLAAKESRDALRNTAIIKMLVDCGLRASELCGLQACDILGDYVKVLGKGAKERTVPVSGEALASIRQYLGSKATVNRNDPVFISQKGQPLNRDSLRLIIRRLAEYAGVNNAHPHKFRHTFAINYILNGGDPYSLQMILGHSTLEMVKRYLHITNHSILTVYSRSSPLKNWGLE